MKKSSKSVQMKTPRTPKNAHSHNPEAAPIRSPTLHSSSSVVGREGMTSQSEDSLQGISGKTYRLERSIGGGGSAQVFEAKDNLGTVVAVKIRRNNAQAISNWLDFSREVALLKQLTTANVPGVPEVLDYGKWGDRPFFVMKYLQDAVPLAKWCPSALDRLLKVALSLSTTLEAIHREGFLHGDLSPNNALLIIDHTLQPLLIDFGGCVRIGQQKVVDGTPGFRPKLDTIQLNEASDVESLAMTLKELAQRLLKKTQESRLPDGHVQRLIAVLDEAIDRPRTVSVFIQRLMEIGKTQERIVLVNQDFDQPMNAIVPSELIATAAKLHEYHDPEATDADHDRRTIEFPVVDLDRYIDLATTLERLELWSPGGVVARECAQFFWNLGSHLVGQMFPQLFAATRYQLKAIKIGKDYQVLQPLELAYWYNEIRMSLLGCGEPLLARAITEKSLEIRQAVEVESSPAVAQSQNNLAFLLKDVNRQRSSQLARKARENWRKELGEIHNETLWANQNYAAELIAEGHLDTAEGVLFHAIQNRAKSLGDTHPQIVSMLNKLACLRRFQDRMADCEEILRHAITIRERVFGPLNPRTLQSKNRLSEHWIDLGEFAKARRVLGELMPSLLLEIPSGEAETAARHLLAISTRLGEKDTAQQYAVTLEAIQSVNLAQKTPQSRLPFDIDLDAM